MEQREDLNSILPFLPLILRSSSLFWPSKALESLKALSLGPDISGVDSGEILFDAITDLRDSVGLSAADWIAPRAADGFILFFDELMSRMDSRAWFREVVPGLARLMLRLPSLLEEHYQDPGGRGGGKSGLRLLDKQEAGIVLLSQELIAALLACALFCLFPASGRSKKHLPTINFDELFASLHPNMNQSQEQKVRCLIHYFERICLCTPTGFVSFERKVLPLDHTCQCISYPEAAFWRRSNIPLCSFEVLSSGLIEDQTHGALEVDFANEYLGGGALHRGCVQEEIRFMINPELITGILFMTSMAENEAIEIVGAERFSSYMGYGSSFRFVGDYLDNKPFDSMGRRKTRIVAIDALHRPGMRQYGSKCLLRETNKAFCGFYDGSKYQSYVKIFKDGGYNNHSHQCGHEFHEASCNNFSVRDETSTETRISNFPALHETGSASNLNMIGNSNYGNFQVEDSLDNIGIATGNWGCGAFGGDPEIKSMIQWLAASQALRPFVNYYTFGQASLQKLEKVTRWVLLHRWSVGDLWSMMVEYSTQRLNAKTSVGFLSWLLPDGEEDTTPTPNDVQYMCWSP